ncbi:hypothetical protein HBH98_148320 [Parastagonospora nodorum]|nr:hypothetical protein HBH53_165020 [Parastagonospora nodorum]KAH4006652.1 hypothetical protein HBI10_011630 [Parastagonospora nodorum]KAH4011547.1 hypothetical protein HBI13_198940 [Parastagonospora nodorum]KAH4034532.1 hypothetical protein HBI09_100040 [Parastagonospora nodorum]KAH4176815.1 hypothetical protein HBH43_044180 [Parastagonospora nodorum]
MSMEGECRLQALNRYWSAKLVPLKKPNEANRGNSLKLGLAKACAVLDVVVRRVDVEVYEYARYSTHDCRNLSTVPAYGPELLKPYASIE